MRRLHLKPEARRRLYALPPKHRDALFVALDDLEDSSRLGKPLAHEWEGAYRVACGPYRIVCQPLGDALVIHRIEHRAQVYRPR